MTAENSSICVKIEVRGHAWDCPLPCCGGRRAVKPRVISAQIATYVMRQHYAIWGKRSTEGPPARSLLPLAGAGWWKGPYRGAEREMWEIVFSVPLGLCAALARPSITGDFLPVRAERPHRRSDVVFERDKAGMTIVVPFSAAWPPQRLSAVGAPTDLQRSRTSRDRRDDGGEPG